MSTVIRTRFAPSPTGFMHVGGVRTALFAYLVARQANGQFILRLEDTDQKREVAGADEHLMKSLHILGLDYDEGPDKPGMFGPYRQSERLDLYKTWAKRLVETGRAYADPYTPQQVQTFREQAQREKRPFLYRNHRPGHPPVWDGSTPLRFKSDPKSYQWHDEVMGDLKAGPEVIDDFVLIKSDGYPTYNFAHIVDDAEMQITHIIRGQEFLASMPNYLNLYEALGFNMSSVSSEAKTEHALPVFATMPHIMNEQGNKKLGKRDGAKDVLDYVSEGFLPDALISFIATLGWNDGTTQEVFSRQELIEKFSLARVQKSGARFDQRRLLWVNGQVIRGLDISAIYTLCQAYWPPTAQNYDDSYKKQVLGLVQERLKYLAELPELTSFFFAEPTPDMACITNHKQLKKFDKNRLQELLETTIASLERIDFSAPDIQACLNQLLEQTGQKPAVLFSLIRIATTWAPASPELSGSLAVLGKDRSLARLRQAAVIVAGGADPSNVTLK